MKRRIARLVAVAGVSLLLLGIPPGAPASGQEESGLLGFSLSGTSTAISTVYNQPSFGVPADPTFEVRKVYSVTQMDTGPSGRAMGSVAWIGDVAGNAPPTLIFDSFLFNPTQLPQLNETCLPIPGPPEGEEPGPQDAFRCADGSGNLALGLTPLKGFAGGAFATAPPYPIRAESFFPPGGNASEEIAGGAGMRSRAGDKAMEASSTTGRAGIPTVISFGSLESSSFSTIEDDVALSISRSRIQDLDILGILHVDTIMTIARATSDGIKAKTESTLQISGLTIKDQNGVEQAKLTVDKTGFHFGDANQDPLGTLAEQVIDKYLKPNGINLTIGGAIPTVDGAVATLGVQGLIISLNSVGMKEMLDRMPEQVRVALKNPSSAPGLQQLFGEGGLLSPTLAGFIATFFQGDQTMQFIFGSSSVTTAASPPLPPFVETDVPPLGPDLGGVAPPLDFGSGDPGTVTPGTPGGPGTVLGTRPVAVLGVPASLLGLILLAGLLGSRYLRGLADRMTTATVAARCPLEET